MRLKTGVKIQGIRPELLFALNVADRVYNTHGEELVITSIKDGKHKVGSKHYSGDAADLRIKFFTEPKKKEVHARLIASLGQDYDVVLHETHIHVEFDPKYA